MPLFPETPMTEMIDQASDIEIATQRRPELLALDFEQRRATVDLSEARNDLLPTVDAQVVGSQDMGSPTSSKRDKSQFELEAGIFLEVPAQRRGAAGKREAANGKLAQIAAKRRFTEDKIVAEVLTVHAGLNAALDALEQAREAKRLAVYMAEVERRKFELGESDLFALAIREQDAIEAALLEIDAKVAYFVARANYDAALAREWPESQGQLDE